MFSKKDIPNLISVFRLLGSFLLIFTEALSVPFFIIYGITAISDALDGFIARRMKCVSELGSKLDSLCDITLYFVLFAKILTPLEKIMPAIFWYIILTIVIIRVTSYIYAAVKYRVFSSLHTRLNKLTGFSFFLAPFFLKTPYAVYAVFAVCAISALATIEELCIHIQQKEYRSNIKSAFEKKEIQQNDLRKD